MKNYVDVVGIDVSKLTLDAHLHKKAVHSVFSNDSKGFKKLIVWVKSQLGDASVFYCFENTGNYSLKTIYLLCRTRSDLYRRKPSDHKAVCWYHKR